MAYELAPKTLFLTLIALGVALEVAGDVLFKRWAVEGRGALLLWGLGVYFAGGAFWALSLRYEFLSRAITVFTVLNLVAVAALGVWLFGEELSSLNKLGIALGLASVVLVEM